MKLDQCTVTHAHCRGISTRFICGPRALSDAERADLLAEFVETYGPPQIVPAYISADGWQLLTIGEPTASASNGKAAPKAKKAPAAAGA